MQRVTPVVASIGCTEPWNAAGLGLDIRALAASGVRPVTVVAGVTAQDANGVRAMQAMPPELVRAQLAALADANVSAYRIGALLDRATVSVVAAHLASGAVPSVYDPVLAASGGGAFAGEDAIEAMLSSLLPEVTLVTPNLAEAATLAGFPVDSIDDMESAARRLIELGAHAALVKGGHLRGTPFDVLVDEDGVVLYEAPRIAGSLRGTGCLLACGIAAALARGAPLRVAVAAGRSFVRERFERAVNLGPMRVAF